MEWESLCSPDESFEEGNQTDDPELLDRFDAHLDSEMAVIEPEGYYDNDDQFGPEVLSGVYDPAVDFGQFERPDNLASRFYEDALALTGLDSATDPGDASNCQALEAYDTAESWNFQPLEAGETAEFDCAPSFSTGLMDLDTGHSENDFEPYSPDAAVPVLFDSYSALEGEPSTQEPLLEAFDYPHTTSFAEVGADAEVDWGLPEEPLGSLHDLKVVPPPAPFEPTVIRKEGPNVPNPTEYGFKASGPEVELRPGEHALGDHLNPRGPSPTPFISASENPKGAPNIGGKPYHIGVEEARRAGAEFYSNADVTADLEAMAKENPSYQARTEMWKANQLRGEQEALFKGDVPASAVETGGMRALKTAGRVAGVAGAALTVYDLAEATQESIEEGTPAPIIAEGVRQVGGWGGAVAGAQAGAALGAAVGLTTGPGAIVTGIAGGLIGGVAGFFAADQVADLIHKDE